MKKSIEDKLNVAGVVALVIGVVGMYVFLPVLVFGFAYFGGMILQWVIGDTLTNGLNLIFDTTRFTPQIIPLFCATLATVGRYFKSSHTTKKEKEN